jgi:hypothetical protein
MHKIFLSICICNVVWWNENGKSMFQEETNKKGRIISGPALDL